MSRVLGIHPIVDRPRAIDRYIEYFGGPDPLHRRDRARGSDRSRPAHPGHRHARATAGAGPTTDRVESLSVA
jgi:hypothetical protein